MPVTIVHVRVKPDCVDGFIEACKANHAGSVAEPGNRRFDVLQLEDDPTRFALYEWFDSDDDIARHKETAHYKAWREAVDAMMAEPRQGVRYKALAPDV
jgi:autoinducer 2-degrading protein